MNPNPSATGCTETRALFSSYLDGAVSGRQMQSVAGHLAGCPACRDDFDRWQQVQSMLSTVGPLKAPAGLGLKLRVAISQEHARRQRRWQDAVAVRWENRMRPMLLQFSAGLAGALVLIGGLAMLVGAVAAPTPVMANDEPLGAMTTPHLLYSNASASPVLADSDSTVVVEACINAKGEVYDFRVLAGPQDPATMGEVRHQMLMQVYTPAHVFGEPVSGQAIVTFSGVSVHG